MQNYFLQMKKIKMIQTRIHVNTQSTKLRNSTFIIKILKKRFQYELRLKFIIYLYRNDFS